jgi:hypothetical protein
MKPEILGIELDMEVKKTKISRKIPRFYQYKWVSYSAFSEGTMF